MGALASYLSAAAIGLGLVGLYLAIRANPGILSQDSTLARNTLSNLTPLDYSNPMGFFQSLEQANQEKQLLVAQYNQVKSEYAINVKEQVGYEQGVLRKSFGINPTWPADQIAYFLGKQREQGAAQERLNVLRTEEKQLDILIPLFKSEAGL